MALGVNADLTRLRTRWWGSGSCQIITLRMTSCERTVAVVERLFDDLRVVDARVVPEDHVGLGEAGEHPRAVEDLGPVLVDGRHAAQLVVQRVELAAPCRDRRATP